MAVLGEGKLADIARDLVTSVRRSITVDWTSREDVRAKLRHVAELLGGFGGEGVQSSSVGRG